MQNFSDVQNINLGGRHWLVRTVNLNVQDDDLEARIAVALTNVDVLAAPGEMRALIEIEQQIKARFRDWDAAIIDADNPYLLVGPSSSIARLLAQRSKARTPTGDEVVLGSYPSLPHLSDVPTLPGEGEIDPFGQNKNMVLSAWLEAATAIGFLVKRSHDVGLAFTLPRLPPGAVDVKLKPWETVVMLDEEPTRLGSIRLDDSSNKSENVTSQIECVLDLMQRSLLVSAAYGEAEEDRITALQVVADALGYYLASGSMDPQSIDDVVFEYFIGDLIAVFHATNTIHGDIHRGNFVLDKGNRLLRPIDASLCLLRRPLTKDERARDLAVFKLQCTAEQWEALKLGYRGYDGQMGDELFGERY